MKIRSVLSCFDDASPAKRYPANGVSSVKSVEYNVGGNVERAQTTIRDER